MSTVMIHKGTKVETPLELQDDEDVLFVCPHKNGVMRRIPDGCLKGLLTLMTLGLILIFKPTKQWNVNLVVTNKRLVTIPRPPNKKKFAVESFYYKDINKTITMRPQNQNEAATVAKFYITMKPGKNSSSLAEGEFWVCYQMTARNLLKAFQASEADYAANYGSALDQSLGHFNATAQTSINKGIAEQTGQSSYTAVSPNYGKMQAAAKERSANMDFSKSGHAEIRDFIVDLVNEYIEIENS